MADNNENNNNKPTGEEGEDGEAFEIPMGRGGAFPQGTDQGFMDMNDVMRMMMMAMGGAKPGGFMPFMSYGGEGGEEGPEEEENVNEIDQLVSEAQMLIQMGDEARGLEILHQAEKLAKEADDKHRMAVVLNNIAHAYTLQGDTVKAKENLYNSLTICSAIKDEEGEMAAYRGIASILIEEGTADAASQAVEMLEKALVIAERTQDEMGIRRTRGLMRRAKLVINPNDEQVKKEIEEEEANAAAAADDEEYAANNFLQQAFASMMAQQQGGAQGNPFFAAMNPHFHGGIDGDEGDDADGQGKDHDEDDDDVVPPKPAPRSGPMFEEVDD